MKSTKHSATILRLSLLHPMKPAHVSSRSSASRRLRLLPLAVLAAMTSSAIATVPNPEANPPVIGDIISGGGTSLQINVTWVLPGAVIPQTLSVASITSGDITVTGPGGPLTVTGVITTPVVDAAPIVATYTVAPPGGSWDAGDNGSYTLDTVNGAVCDNGTLGPPTCNSEQQNLATFNVAIPDPKLVLHWPLEEGSGTATAETVSGETSVAQLVDGPAWTTGIAPGSSNAVDFDRSTTPGNFIDAGTLETDGDYVPVTAPPTDHRVLSGNWTASGWIRLEQSAYTSQDNCIITSDFGSGTGWLFGVRTSYGFPDSLFFDFGSTRQYSGITVPRGQAVFVAIAVDASASSFGPGNRHRYSMWDGSSWQHSEGTTSGNLRLEGLEIGSFATGQNQFDGVIDDVSIYDKTLADADLTALALTGAIGGDLAATVTEPAAGSNATSIDFAVQFSEAVQNFAAADLDITTTGTLTVPSTPVISGSANSYTVSIPVSGGGTIALNLLTGGGVQTLDGAPLAVTVGSKPVTVDQMAPQVSSITLIGAHPTPALDVSFDVVFDEPVVNFNAAADVEVLHNGTNSTGVSITGSGDTYVVTVTGVTGDGFFAIRPNTGSDVQDPYGNALASTLTSAPTNHFVDTEPPSVVSITPDSTGPITGDQVGFTVVFSEAVRGVDGGESLPVIFNQTGLGFIDVDEITTADGITYTFPVDAGVADGLASGSFTATVDLTGGITDLAGNALTTPNPTSSSVTVSATAYQLWAISKGLTAGSNFSYALDADGDLRSNGEEFMRDGNPLAAGDQPKQRMHIATIGGMDYGTLTIAAPVGVAYQLNAKGPPAWIEGEFLDYSVFMVDQFTPSSDLQNFGTGDPLLVEDPTITSPPGLPTLTTGWSYRHFRFTEPVGSLPRAFIRIDTYDAGW